jgi:hypothetical protein
LACFVICPLKEAVELREGDPVELVEWVLTPEGAEMDPVTSRLQRRQVLAPQIIEVKRHDFTKRPRNCSIGAVER